MLFAQAFGGLAHLVAQLRQLHLQIVNDAANAGLAHHFILLQANIAAGRVQRLLQAGQLDRFRFARFGHHDAVFLLEPCLGGFGGLQGAQRPLGLFGIPFRRAAGRIGAEPQRVVDIGLTQGVHRAAGHFGFRPFVGDFHDVGTFDQSHLHALHCQAATSAALLVNPSLSTASPAMR